MPKSFDILKDLLYSTSIRHKVLASNIANSDTPGYKARDVDFKGVVKEEMLRMKTTDSRHITPAQGKPVGSPQVTGDQPWEDKNTVELDLEIAKLTENSLLHNASAKLLSQKISQFKQAVRGR